MKLSNTILFTLMSFLALIGQTTTASSNAPVAIKTMPHHARLSEQQKQKLIALYKLAEDDDDEQQDAPKKTNKPSLSTKELSIEQYLAFIQRLKKHLPSISNDTKISDEFIQAMSPYTKKLLAHMNREKILPYTHAFYAFLAWSIYLFMFSYSPYKIAFYENLYLPYIRWKPYRPRLQPSSIPSAAQYEVEENELEDSEERKERIAKLQEELDRIVEDIHNLKNAHLDQQIKDDTLFTLNQEKEAIKTKLLLLQKHVSPLFYYDRNKTPLSLTTPLVCTVVATLLVAGSYDKTKNELDPSPENFFNNLYKNFEFLWT